MNIELLYEYLLYREKLFNQLRLFPHHRSKTIIGHLVHLRRHLFSGPLPDDWVVTMEQMRAGEIDHIIVLDLKNMDNV